MPLGESIESELAVKATDHEHNVGPPVVLGREGLHLLSAGSVQNSQLGGEGNTKHSKLQVHVSRVHAMTPVFVPPPPEMPVVSHFILSGVF